MAHPPTEEHHLPIARTARYYSVGTPGPRVKEVWFACHGYGQLARYFVRRLAPLADGTRLIVAPEALSRFYLGQPGSVGSHATARVGATWMTREDRLQEIQDYVGYLDAVAVQVLASLQPARLRVVLLGFSQGVATVCRWAALGAVPVDALILWAHGVPPDLDLAQAAPRLARGRVWLVAGESDPALSAAALSAQRGRLEEHGLRPEIVTFAGGHQLDGGALREIAARLRSGRGDSGAIA